ncbi:MAG TPA: LysR family transcriptional regulator, partial [Polyangia bacterium]|nr:LysR family transcriptional regulator [Polyangia bacterium]
MQIARLEGFYWVARTGGYAAAARAFPYPLTQPAVFQQVRKLEDELGVRLFERVGKAEVRLTAAGRQLYGHAAPFFEGLPAVERALKAATPAREVRLAAEALILQQLLPGWIRLLQRREPELRVEVRELAAPDPEVVRSGDVDLAVAYFPEPLSAGLASRPVATLSSFLVLPAGGE